jgi:3-oxoacyl-[acyl-carrier protein] reductase
MQKPMEEKKHVVISGGSRGLGKAIVESLLGSAYKVSTFSRAATEFTKTLTGNPDFFYASVDSRDDKSLAAFVKAAEDKLGSPYALINCAGVAIDGVLATMPVDAIDRVLDINLRGALQLSKLVIRRMLLRKDGGVILNISSIIGLRGYSGLSAYAATKGGMDAMTRALARELGDRSIRVNSIAPGYLKTEMTHNLSDQQRQQIVRRTPLGRLGTPQDVVGAVHFLLSPSAEFITGQVLVVDGGITC